MESKSCNPVDVNVKPAVHGFVPFRPNKRAGWFKDCSRCGSAVLPIVLPCASPAVVATAAVAPVTRRLNVDDMDGVEIVLPSVAFLP